MARLHPTIADVAKQFVLVRVGNMRGLDLNDFDFDYDVTWMGVFVSARGAVLGRYGRREAPSLLGLRFALERALAKTKSHQVEVREPQTPRRVEDFAAARRFSTTACFHCHHVYEFDREARQAAGTWRREDLWVYPEPANLGLTLDPDRGNRIKGVAADSPADRAGLRAGDDLGEVHGQPVASIADFGYALHRGPRQGDLIIHWQRQGAKHQATLQLPRGWKETDLSWRWSLKSLKPAPQIQGDDLTFTEKKSLGLKPSQLAVRLGPFLSRAARQAGLRTGDVVVGVDALVPHLTTRQFDVFMRTNYQVGDEVTYQVRRGEVVLAVKVKLVD